MEGIQDCVSDLSMEPGFLSPIQYHLHMGRENQCETGVFYGSPVPPC